MGLSRPRQNIHNIKINSIPLPSTGQERLHGLCSRRIESLTLCGDDPDSQEPCARQGREAPSPSQGRGVEHIDLPQHPYPYPLSPPLCRNTCRTSPGYQAFLHGSSVSLLCTRRERADRETAPLCVCLAKAYKQRGSL